jgi:hypothetical protein
MKSLLFAAAIVAFFACSNNATEETSVSNSDTTTKLPETPAEVSPAPPSQGKPSDAVKQEPVVVKQKVEDTPRTSISIGKTGAEVKTKKGTGVSVDNKGVKVNNKDIKIDIKRDSL